MELQDASTQANMGKLLLKLPRISLTMNKSLGW